MAIFPLIVVSPPNIESFNIVCRVPDESCILKRDALKQLSFDIRKHLDSITAIVVHMIEGEEHSPEAFERMATLQQECLAMLKVLDDPNLKGRGIV